MEACIIVECKGKGEYVAYLNEDFGRSDRTNGEGTTGSEAVGDLVTKLQKRLGIEIRRG